MVPSGCHHVRVDQIEQPEAAAEWARDGAREVAAAQAREEAEERAREEAERAREIHLTMDLCLRIGEMLLSSGAGAADVTATMRSVGAPSMR